MAVVSLLVVPALFFLFVTHMIMRYRSTNRRVKNTKALPLPPGPRGLPFIGNLHQFYNSNSHQYLLKLSKQFGPLLSLRLGSVPVLVVSSAKMAEQVLKVHDLQFCSRPALLGQQKLSYNGSDLAFAPYNSYWRQIRKICVVHLFNSSRTRSFRPVREDEVSRMIEKVSRSVVASKPVNLSEETVSLACSMTCRIGFGKKYEDQRSERCMFHTLLNEAQAMLASFFFTDYFPSIGCWVDKLTGMISRLERIFKELDAFYQAVIDEHLDPKRIRTDQQQTIVDVLLEAQKENGLKFDLTYDNIKAVLMNVFIAGTDTSAATLVWAMSYLMKFPRAMKKVQEEIRSSMGTKGFVDEDDLKNLSYLKAVVKETLRLQPATPLLIARETMETCIIDRYEIPRKTQVLVNAYAVGRDPDAWESPDEFYPERFIDSSVDFKGHHFQFIPFGAGRRICPGMSMGMAAVDLALANLLYKFDWEMPPGMDKEEIDFDVLPGVTMHKKNMLSLMAKHRNSSC